MNNLRNKLIVGGMAAVTMVAFFASTAGTLAWYAYSTRVTLSYTGTSVRKSELIHIGLVDSFGSWKVDELHPDGYDDPSTHHLTNEEVGKYELTREVCGNNSIVWTTASTGFPQEAIKTYLSRTAYSFNYLSPVSSKARTPSGPLTLYQSPGYGVTNVTEIAGTGQYVCLPFAFKSIGSDNQNLKNEKIWLVDAEVLASDQYLNEAVRLHIQDPTIESTDPNYFNSQFLINPNIKTGTTGSTKVGGLLDLDGDGTYDYDLTDPVNPNEYVYGDLNSGSPTYSATKYDVDVDVAQPVNVNQVDLVKYPNMSTFYAKHKKGTYTVTNYNTLDYALAEYYTLGSIVPSLDGDGYFDENTGKPIATTDSVIGVGYATMTIYLEGWDHSIINAAIGCRFSLGLTFEINKL